MLNEISQTQEDQYYTFTSCIEPWLKFIHMCVSPCMCLWVNRLEGGPRDRRKRSEDRRQIERAAEYISQGSKNEGWLGEEREQESGKERMQVLTTGKNT